MYKEALAKSSRKLLGLSEQNLIVDYALIGGFAISTYLEPRATADIDFAISAPLENLDTIAQRLDGKAHRGDIYDPLSATISFALGSSNSAVPVQLILFHKAIEQIIFVKKNFITVNKVEVPVAHPRALLLLKLYAGGPVDLNDAEQLNKHASLSKDDRKYIESKARSLRLLNRLKKVF